jgi:hypothetical protein
MFTLPPDMMACVCAFALVFSKRFWQHALILVVGAILAPGQLMVTSVVFLQHQAEHLGGLGAQR